MRWWHAVLLIAWLIVWACGPESTTDQLAKAGGRQEPVQLAWDPNPPEQQVTSYRIYRSFTQDGAASLVTEVGGTAFTDAVPQGKHLACYEVTAVNAAAESGHSPRVCKVW
jgi:fibronectin type 3 domain-containing protein